MVRAEEVNLVVLVPPTTSSAEGTSEYFPLAPAVESVVRLAAEHLNEDASLLDGDEVTLSVVASLQATEAASGLCSAIEGNATFAVSEIADRRMTATASVLSCLMLCACSLPVGSKALSCLCVVAQLRYKRGRSLLPW